VLKARLFAFIGGWLLVPAVFVGVAKAGTLPDPKLTPGVVTDLTTGEICSRKWGRDERHVSAATKRAVLAEYSLSGNTDPYCLPNGCEIDHLISRELGGADDIRNLWPQSHSGPWNAGMKDKLEDRLRREVCEGH
jgi:hypothetical protein